MAKINTRKSEAAPGDGLTYKWKEPPAPGTAIEVVRGIHWIRMPLPFALNHINLWILEEDGGCVLVDTGYNSPETKDLWADLFDGPFAHLKPKKLVCTHHHPDHMGLAGWLSEKFQIPLWTTVKEWDAYHRLFVAGHDAFIDRMGIFYERGGVPKERQDSDLARRKSGTKRTGAEPKEFDALSGGDTITVGRDRWTVHVGEGHAPELAALFDADRNILISGDQILPKISPNVSVMPFDLDADPLKEFMDSLRAFRALPADTMVLPSHKLPFTGLHTRIDDLIQHHEDRLTDALEACRKPASAADVTKVLFPRALNDHQYFFALGETLAHLNFLWHSEVLSRTEDSSGQFSYSVT